MKFKLLNVKSGISEKTGKPYCCATFCSTKADGTRIIKDFWLDVKLIEVSLLKMDAEYRLETMLDENLNYRIVSVDEVSEIE